MGKRAKLLKRVYYAAKHHAELHASLGNHPLRDDGARAESKGARAAYEYIMQMIEKSDTIGKTDYKDIFDMPKTFPKKIY